MFYNEQEDMDRWIDKYTYYTINFMNLRTTPQNMKYFLTWQLNLPIGLYQFVRINERPNVWKHSCGATGVAELIPYNFIYNNDVPVSCIVCNECKKVIYYAENGW